MNWLLKSLLIVFCFFISHNSSCQEFNYARLSVIYGGNLPFNFISIDDYKNGIRIDNGTVLGITLADSNQVGATLEGFTLRFRSFNAQANIEGDVYNLPLNAIQIEATNNIGLPPAAATIYTGLQDLAIAWVDLVQYTQNPVTPPDFNDLDWANHQINISYECGIGNGTLLGYPGDYYTVEIELELIPTGPGF